MADETVLEHILLPGDILALLRRCSPAIRMASIDGILYPQEPVIVQAIRMEDRELKALIMGASPAHRWYPLRLLALDLTDPTGAYHAALWCYDILDELEAALLQIGEPDVSAWLDRFLYGEADTAHLKQLRDVVLCLAGLVP